MENSATVSLPAVGSRVRCEGLRGAAELNGCLGRVLEHAGERASVRMEGPGGRVVGVKAVNLVVVEPPKPYPPAGMAGYYDPGIYGEHSERVVHVGPRDQRSDNPMAKYIQFAQRLREEAPGHAAFTEAERRCARGERGAMILTPDAACARLASHRWCPAADFDEWARQCIQPALEQVDPKEFIVVAVPITVDGELVAYAAGPFEYSSGRYGVAPSEESGGRKILRFVRELYAGSGPEDAYWDPPRRPARGSPERGVLWMVGEMGGCWSGAAGGKFQPEGTAWLPLEELVRMMEGDPAGPAAYAGVVQAARGYDPALEFVVMVDDPDKGFLHLNLPLDKARLDQL